MSKSVKLTGIELCRGLAAFAVILVHSGDKSWGIPISNSAIEFRKLFYFAVPFFIATYFYFATKRLSQDLNFGFWRRKFKRIVIPYLLWSGLFMSLKSAIAFASGNAEQLAKLWSDPIAVIFFGKASYHLYFLPLLIAGTLLLYSTEYLLKLKNSLLLLVLGLITSIIFNHWLSVSENAFDLGERSAFPSILNMFAFNGFLYSVIRIFLVNLSWIIICIPYFITALIFNHLFKIYRYRWLYYSLTSLLLFCGFIVADTIRSETTLALLFQVIIAYLLLLFGLSISPKIEGNLLISRLGACSFGIYLIHPFIKSIVNVALPRLAPQIAQNVSIASMLSYCLPTFLISWLVVYWLKQHKLLSPYI